MPLNNCEDDLTGADFDQLDPSSSSHLLSRTAGASHSYSLYPYIDQSKSHVLNVTQPSSNRSNTNFNSNHTTYQSIITLIIRPIHTKNNLSMEESLITLQGTGPEMIIHLVFNQLVRVRSIVINVSKGEQAPKQCRVWTNRFNGISFDQVNEIKPDQEWELDTENETAIEYPTRVTRFQSVSSLTFEIREPSGGEQSRIYFLGVLGDVKQLKRDPSSQLTVGAENSSDTTLDSIREQSGGNQTTIR